MNSTISFVVFKSFFFLGYAHVPRDVLNSKSGEAEKQQEKLAQPFLR